MQEWAEKKSDGQGNEGSRLEWPATRPLDDLQARREDRVA
jgi:hypothetical protein